MIKFSEIMDCYDENIELHRLLITPIFHLKKSAKWLIALCNKKSDHEILEKDYFNMEFVCLSLHSLLKSILQTNPNSDFSKKSVGRIISFGKLNNFFLTFH
jgi:hypothetical protein